MSTAEIFTDIIREWSQIFMQRSMHDFKRFMDSTGLSFSQVNILMRLMHGEISSVSEIGDMMGISNAAASQTVDRLVVMGFIERTEDPDDRRTKRLALTDRGRSTIEKGVEARVKWIENVTDTLTTEQQARIISALTLLTEAARQSMKNFDFETHDHHV